MRELIILVIMAALTLVYTGLFIQASQQVSENCQQAGYETGGYSLNLLTIGHKYCAKEVCENTGNNLEICHQEYDYFTNFKLAEPKCLEWKHYYTKNLPCSRLNSCGGGGGTLDCACWSNEPCAYEGWEQ